VPRILLRTEVPASALDCFTLSLSVDAHTASMARSGERIVGGVASGAMGLGDSVTWQARHFGIPFRMTSRITEYDAPRRFVDEQVSGPFAHWWHEHRFEESDGVTLMTDTVEFASPLGPLGKLGDTAFLTGYLTRLLSQRNRYLAETLS
jgi:ligand-binding SRPBCC domain-containing protein